jgi:DNA repair protein RecN (Recombination protein N)
MRSSLDPATLEQVEDRLFSLRALARKHGVAPDDLGDHAAALRERLETLDAGDSGLARLLSAGRNGGTRASGCGLRGARRVAPAGGAGAGCRNGRRTCAPEDGARGVPDDHHPGRSRPRGCDTVTFEVATNPGAPAGALNRIASGGELSRFLLALKVCLHRREAGVTMIFDEIDRGVGGATAAAVGRRLQALAEGAQVLVVTHSPQVAALGAHHWRVEKRVVDAVTLSHVTPLSADARIDEIARMLSGDTITEAARAAARALIAPDAAA